MREAEFFRKGQTIRGPEGDTAFPSINAAKRASRDIQHARGGLGRGALRVVTRMPAKKKATLTPPTLKSTVWLATAAALATTV